jgi:hypothetical protein
MRDMGGIVEVRGILVKLGVASFEILHLAARKMIRKHYL